MTPTLGKIRARRQFQQAMAAKMRTTSKTGRQHDGTQHLAQVQIPMHLRKKLYNRNVLSFIR
jgi:hypothetical protein